MTQEDKDTTLFSQLFTLLERIPDGRVRLIVVNTTGRHQLGFRKVRRTDEGLLSVRRQNIDNRIYKTGCSIRIY